MPRVFVNETDRMVWRFREFVVGRIANLELSQSAIAKEMNMPQQTFNYKVHHLNFSLPEMINLFAILEVDQDELTTLFLKKGARKCTN